MTKTLLHLCVFALLSACASAQQETQTWTTGPEPILRAETRITLCVQGYASKAEKLAQCVGGYAQSCMNVSAEGTTTLGMMTCTMEEVSAWNDRLDASFERLRGRLDPPVVAALETAQQAWTVSRDADCALEIAPYEGGSIQRLIAADCQLALTAERALQLEDWQAHLPPF